MLSCPAAGSSSTQPGALHTPSAGIRPRSCMSCAANNVLSPVLAGCQTSSVTRTDGTRAKLPADPARSSIVGELDFFLQRPRSFLARADSPAELLVLPRPEFERMAAQAPDLATLLQVRQGLGSPGIAWSGPYRAAHPAATAAHRAAVHRLTVAAQAVSLRGPLGRCISALKLQGRLIMSTCRTCAGGCAAVHIAVGGTCAGGPGEGWAELGRHLRQPDGMPSAGFQAAESQLRHVHQQLAAPSGRYNMVDLQQSCRRHCNIWLHPAMPLYSMALKSELQGAYKAATHNKLQPCPPRPATTHGPTGCAHGHLMLRSTCRMETRLLVVGDAADPAAPPSCTECKAYSTRALHPGLVKYHISASVTSKGGSGPVSPDTLNGMRAAHTALHVGCKVSTRAALLTGSAMRALH